MVLRCLAVEERVASFIINQYPPEVKELYGSRPPSYSCLFQNTKATLDDKWTTTRKVLKPHNPGAMRNSCGETTFKTLSKN
jgi:hypothetical protein